MTTILLVNDSPIQNAILGSILRAGDYSVACATTVLEARQVCQQSEVALSLVELLMFQDNGFEVAPLVRRMSKAPVVLLLSRYLEADIMWAKSLGMAGFLYRPVSAKALMKCIEEHLQSSREDSCKNSN